MALKAEAIGPADDPWALAGANGGRDGWLVGVSISGYRSNVAMPAGRTPASVLEHYEAAARSPAPHGIQPWIGRPLERAVRFLDPTHDDV